jgi:hypothetical protein
MLCYAMLCYVIYPMLCYPMLCYIMLCYPILYYIMPCHAMISYLYYAILCHAILYDPMLYLRYAMLCHPSHAAEMSSMPSGDKERVSALWRDFIRVFFDLPVHFLYSGPAAERASTARGLPEDHPHYALHRGEGEEALGNACMYIIIYIWCIVLHCIVLHIVIQL